MEKLVNSSYDAVVSVGPRPWKYRVKNNYIFTENSDGFVVQRASSVFIQNFPAMYTHAHAHAHTHKYARARRFVVSIDVNVRGFACLETLS